MSTKKLKFRTRIYIQIKNISLVPTYTYKNLIPILTETNQHKIPIQLMKVFNKPKKKFFDRNRRHNQQQNFFACLIQFNLINLFTLLNYKCHVEVHPF